MNMHQASNNTYDILGIGAGILVPLALLFASALALEIGGASAPGRAAAAAAPQTHAAVAPREAPRRLARLRAAWPATLQDPSRDE